MGFPKLGITYLGGPHNKDYSILWSILARGLPSLRPPDSTQAVAGSKMSDSRVRSCGLISWDARFTMETEGAKGPKFRVV